MKVIGSIKSPTLRNYQENMLADIALNLNEGQKEVVLAACPSSGKTKMAIEFIKRNKHMRFLVLTHGTIVLKDQWKHEFKNNHLDASDILGKSRITYAIPQGLRTKDLAKLGNIDCIIIDEAHQFAMAETVKAIRAELDPQFTVFLTGTPSKFIRDGKAKVLFIDALTLIEQGFISDLYVGVVSTKIDLKQGDYNKEGDVKETSFGALEESVKGTLKGLLPGIHKRISETKSDIKITKNWKDSLHRLKKTMFACASIKQAEKVETYFRKMKVNVVGSNSKNDPHNFNIMRFLNDPSIEVLVVVDRGILGFNMPALVNVVDMTGSRNIDRIYQLYARVMRKDKNNPYKFFFKIVPSESEEYGKMCMNAALSMVSINFISKFNGQNLKGMKVPTVSSEGSAGETPDGNGSGSSGDIGANGLQLAADGPIIGLAGLDKASGGKPSKLSGKSRTPRNLFSGDLGAFQILRDIENKINSDTKEFCYRSIGNIRREEFGDIVRDLNDTILKLTKAAEKKEPKPPGRSELGRSLSYIKNRHPDVAEKLKALSPDWFMSRLDMFICELKDFKAKNPNVLIRRYKNKNSAEYYQARRLYIKMRNLVDEHGKKIIYDLIDKNGLNSLFKRITLSSEEKLLNAIPIGVSFCGVSEYRVKSPAIYYKFNCSKYGEFRSPLYNVIKAWKAGLSGHPSDGFERRRKCFSHPLLCLETGEIFDSLKQLSTSIGKHPVTITRAIEKNKTLLGYHWAFYDVSKHIVKKDWMKQAA